MKHTISEGLIQVIFSMWCLYKNNRVSERWGSTCLGWTILRDDLQHCPYQSSSL